MGFLENPCLLHIISRLPHSCQSVSLPIQITIPTLNSALTAQKIVDTSAETLIVSNGTAYWYLNHYIHDGNNNFNTGKIPTQYLPKITTLNIVNVFINNTNYIGFACVYSHSIIEARYMPNYPGSGLIPKGAVINGVVIWKY